MDNQVDEALKARINERLKNTSVTNYAYVKVLLLYWEASGPGAAEENIAFQNEGRELGEFLSTHFQYAVEEYAIPFEFSQLSLQRRVAEEVIMASRPAQAGQKALLIIHYGGHGDEDEDPERRSVWAGSATPQKGESLVFWYKIQETLEDSKSDILLLLDCCFSARAGRARKGTSRIEILTASAKREQTPLPGPKSFTSALIRVIKGILQTEQGITISDVHAHLLKRQVDLYGTPVNIALQPGFPDRSIRLVPLGITSVDFPASDLSGPSIRLLIRTAAFNHENVDKLVSWLRTDLPNEYSLEVESVASQTITIEGLIRDIPKKNEPLMRNLDTSALLEVLTTWESTLDLLSSHRSHREDLQGSHGNLALLRHRSLELFEQLRHKNAIMVDTMEQAILLSPNLTDGARLDEVIQAPSTNALGISHQLRLRQMIDSPQQTHAENLMEDPDSTQQTYQGLTWKEYKSYGQYTNPAELPQLEAHVRLLAELLHASKSSDFCSLRCASWHHDAVEYRYVLTFHVPDAYIRRGNYLSTSLQSIIEEAKGPRRPTLGQRFRIAFAVAKAVRQWHSVGWVHQSINSRNIFLFSTHKDSGYDYDAPFVQGFDFARPNVDPSLGRYVDDITHNVYRHPDRQGPTRKGHTKLHDIYALGVVLLEIGLWEGACVTAGASSRKDRPLAVDKMVQNLKTAAKHRLSHYAGKDYQEAVLVCLEADFGVQMDDEMGSQLAKAFQKRVLDKLMKGAHIR